MMLFSENIALIDDAGVELSYAKLEEAGNRLSKQIENRCLVFLLCKNTVGSVVGYTGFIRNQIVPALLSSDIDEQFLERLLDAYHPVFLWAPKERRIKALEKAKTIYEDFGYVLLKTGYKITEGLYDKLGLLLTTSGSTGSPKFVRQSYENILDNAKAIAQYLSIDENERPITTLPMHYTYGLSIINSHLLMGATVLLTENSVTQREFWRFFKEWNATSFGGVPYTYEILERIRFRNMDLPTLKTMTQAGGKLSPELHKVYAEYAKKQGKRFFVMYGQCEATARMGYLPAERALEKKGSMGIAIPGGRFRLIAEDGTLVRKPYQTGELCYEGKNVTLGYAECAADLFKGDERKGVLMTGDMAQFDEDGYFYVVGRKKRFLKVYGNRVNLDELEGLVKTEFSTECACVGTDDHIVLFITQEGLENKVREYAMKKTGLHITAFRVHKMNELPKNEAGKILYKELECFQTEGRDDV